eukprot:TRINITY_DN5780_c0_g1_i1.p1 TRINITY_DN5780_c0_g1~~TRINITY_DN5780_c0_g1_i1.p1  ORF type:complete len:235 (-),score=36.90 TRINITY_DN5780_c0_g1_i1:6-710(-)
MTPRTLPSVRFAYLHGFASSSASKKGVYLQNVFQAKYGLQLELPDLNYPSFGQLSYTNALTVIDRLDAPASRDEKWCLIGSSMGGYLAARWAELHPDRVHKLVLLCPGFDLASRWPVMLGGLAMRQWEKYGHLKLPDSKGVPTEVHYDFFLDTKRHPTFPQPACPVLIIHGNQDNIVPLESSKRFMSQHQQHQQHQQRRLIEVDDGHELMNPAVLTRIATETASFLELKELARL